MIPSHGGSGNSLHGAELSRRPVVMNTIFLPLPLALQATYLASSPTRYKLESNERIPITAFEHIGRKLVGISMRTKLTCAATALLFVAAVPVFAQQSAQAAEVAGPATCYIADENETILEPRQEYQPAPGAATLPSTPSPVVPGSYTLQTSAPAVNFDPDNPAMHFVCEVQYSHLGRIRLVDPSGQVLASTVYTNDQTDPSRAASTALPQLPGGYEIVPGQSVFGFNEAAQTVDPNNPTNARAVGRDTDIVIRQIAATPTPAPSTSQPPAPIQPATPTTVAPSPSTTAPTTPAPDQPTTQSPKKPELAKTGFESGILAAAALVATAGGAAVTARKRRA